MSLSQIELVWVRVLCKMAESKMAEFKMELKMVAIIKLNQNELVWVRVRVEGECFWVNLREDNKVFESKMAVSESNMAEFKMAAIIKLSQNELVWDTVSEVFFVQNGWIQDGRIQDGCHHQVESEWMTLRWKIQSFVQNGWIQDGRIQDGCHHQVESDWISLSQSQSGGRVFLS